MKYSSVYLKTAASLHEAASLVREELGLRLAYEEFDGEPFFVCLDGDRRILLGRNEFVEPEYAPLDEFELELSVDGSDDDARLRYTRGLFAKLAKLRRMPLLLVDNLVDVDRYDPPTVTV